MTDWKFPTPHPCHFFQLQILLKIHIHFFLVSWVWDPGIRSLEDHWLHLTCLHCKLIRRRCGMKQIEHCRKLMMTLSVYLCLWRNMVMQYSNTKVTTLNNLCLWFKLFRWKLSETLWTKLILFLLYIFFLEKCTLLD